jgi:predicted AAA+ superfamily ATPase
LRAIWSSGDKAQAATRYWFDTRANLRREMEERKKRFEDKNEVRARMAEILKKLAAGATFFDGTHIFTPHSDVPDDGALRLVVLPPEQFYSREEPRPATDGVLDYVRNNGTKPRYRGNRLLFLAPDHGALTRLRDCIRVALAWSSIVEDVAAMRLVLDNLQAEQAKKELKGADDVLPRIARECFKWLLCPSQDNPTGKPTVEFFPLNTSGAALGPEIERVCLDNELVIATWSPIHHSPALEAEGTLLEARQPSQESHRLLGGHSSLPLPAAFERPRRNRTSHRQRSRHSRLLRNGLRRTRGEIRRIQIRRFQCPVR